MAERVPPSRARRVADALHRFAGHVQTYLRVTDERSAVQRAYRRLNATERAVLKKLVTEQLGVGSLSELAPSARAARDHLPTLPGGANRYRVVVDGAPREAEYRHVQQAIRQAEKLHRRPGYRSSNVRVEEWQYRGTDRTLDSLVRKAVVWRPETGEIVPPHLMEKRTKLLGGASSSRRRR